MPYPEDDKRFFREILMGTFGSGQLPEVDRQSAAEYLFRFLMSQALAGMVHGNSEFLSNPRFSDPTTFDIAPLVLSIRLPWIPTVNRRILSQKGLFLAPFNMVKNSLPRSEGKMTLFESNLGGLMAINPDILNGTKEENYMERASLEKAEVIKVILSPDILDDLLLYIRNLSDYGLGLRD
jgi:hypothetical protein